MAHADNTATIYVNGEEILDLVGTHDPGMMSDFDNTIFGTGYDSLKDIHLNGYYNGMMDELRLYTRSLSADEVRELHELGLVFDVQIDIKPGSDPNSINTCSGGTTPVAIFGSESFDVATVSRDQLTLATAQVKTVGKSDKLLCSVEDIGAPDDESFDGLDPNPDGFLDLVCHFVTFALDLSDTSTEADLVITGCDFPSSGCDESDPGFYVVTATDAVNVVRDCN
jgi:hypothetical protein